MCFLSWPPHFLLAGQQRCDGPLASLSVLHVCRASKQTEGVWLPLWALIEKCMCGHGFVFPLWVLFEWCYEN